MPHDHHHPVNIKEGQELKFKISIGLNLIIALAEVVGGLISGSLALISDAMHNLSDTFSLITSYIAIKLSRKAKTETRTFGYKRAEILAALLNSSILFGIGLYMLKEVITRIQNPEPVNVKVMLPVAIIGLIANLVAVLLLRSEADKSINIKSAYLHLFADTLSSVAVIIGGIFMYLYQVYWIDWVLSIIIAFYVLRGSYGILKTSVHILMQNVPEEINIQEVKQTLERLNDIRDVHHVHVWQLTESDIHFEAHIHLTQNLDIESCCTIRNQIEALLTEKFDINHITIQFEFGTCSNEHLQAL